MSISQTGSVIGSVYDLFSQPEAANPALSAQGKESVFSRYFAEFSANGAETNAISPNDLRLEINQLHESLNAQLGQLFLTAGINTDEKVTFKVHPDGTVELAGEHSKPKEIAALLNQYQGVQTAIRDLARLTQAEQVLLSDRVDVAPELTFEPAAASDFSFESEMEKFILDWLFEYFDHRHKLHEAKQGRDVQESKVKNTLDQEQGGEADTAADALLSQSESSRNTLADQYGSRLSEVETAQLEAMTAAMPEALSRYLKNYETIREQAERLIRKTEIIKAGAQDVIAETGKPRVTLASATLFR